MDSMEGLVPIGLPRKYHGPLPLHWWLYWLFPSPPQVNQEELAKVSQALRVSEKVRHDLHLELDEAVDAMDAMDATRLPQPEAAEAADVEEMVTWICSRSVCYFTIGESIGNMFYSYWWPP